MCLIGCPDISYAVGGGVQGGGQGPSNFVYDCIFLKNKCICVFSITGIVLSIFKFISSDTDGRGFVGPMQPGVFHGYPLKSPKVQGET